MVQETFRFRNRFGTGHSFGFGDTPDSVPKIISETVCRSKCCLINSILFLPFPYFFGTHWRFCRQVLQCSPLDGKQRTSWLKNLVNVFFVRIFFRGCYGACQLGENEANQDQCFRAERKAEENKQKLLLMVHPRIERGLLHNIVDSSSNGCRCIPYASRPYPK